MSRSNIGFDELFFPLLGMVVGGGYITAILMNNNINDVLHSPQAMIILAMLLIVALFPIKSWLTSGEEK